MMHLKSTLISERSHTERFHIVSHSTYITFWERDTYKDKSQIGDYNGSWWAGIRKNWLHWGTGNILW
jgi:hypothetical protein